MRRLSILSALFILLVCGASSQPQADYGKISAHLATLVQRGGNPSHMAPTTDGHEVDALMTISGGDIHDLSDRYSFRVTDSIGRIYIISIPVRCAGPLSLDSHVERIEAERMPRMAMDVTTRWVATPACSTPPQAWAKWSSRSIKASIRTRVAMCTT